MLPMFDNKKMVSLISARKGKKDVEIMPEVEGPGETDPQLKDLAMDIMSAIEHKSVVDLVDALQDFFYVCDAMPHEEGEHEMEE
jgi:hypothetical protein